MLSPRCAAAYKSYPLPVYISSHFETTDHTQLDRIHPHGVSLDHWGATVAQPLPSHTEHASVAVRSYAVSVAYAHALGLLAPAGTVA